MQYELSQYNRGATDEELLGDLRRVAELLGTRKVSIVAYSKNGRYHACTLQRRFGSWFGALQRSALERTRNLNISDDALFDSLAAIWESLGRQPKYGEVKKPISQFSAGTYEKRFGGWRKALEAFVKWASGVPGEAADLVVVDSRDRAAQTEQEREDAFSNTSSVATPRQSTERQRFKVFLRDGFRCQACGKSPITHPGTILHADHVEPWSRGGATSVENLRTLCDKCNLGKGAM